MKFQEFDKKSPPRTPNQNAALHLFFSMIAEDLNRDGISVQRVLKVMAETGVEQTWSAKLVKEIIWRPIQKDNLGKTSTTELNSVWDITKIYDIVNKFLSENFFISEPFPNKDEQAQENNEENY